MKIFFTSLKLLKYVELHKSLIKVSKLTYTCYGHGYVREHVQCSCLVMSSEIYEQNICWYLHEYYYVGLSTEDLS